MKKHNLVVGIIYVLIGLICFCIVLLTNTRLESLLCGFAGAGIVSGLMMIYKYVYWTLPKHKQQYEERLEQERIELHDELKEKLRDKSGRYTYLLSMAMLAVFIVVFAILDAFALAGSSKVFVLFLSGYLILQVMMGNIIYKHLLKKYI